jgi:hypothetical protein
MLVARVSEQLLSAGPYSESVYTESSAAMVDMVEVEFGKGPTPLCKLLIAAAR